MAMATKNKFPVASWLIIYFPMERPVIAIFTQVVINESLYPLVYFILPPCQEGSRWPRKHYLKNGPLKVLFYILCHFCQVFYGEATKFAYTVFCQINTLIWINIAPTFEFTWPYIRNHWTDLIQTLGTFGCIYLAKYGKTDGRKPGGHVHLFMCFLSCWCILPAAITGPTSSPVCLGC